MGVKADALSSSSSAAQGAAGGWSASSGGTPSRSTSVDSTLRELLELSFHVIQQLVLDLKTSVLIRGRLFALKPAALPQRPPHVHPYTASMRPNAHLFHPTGHASMADTSSIP